LQRHVEIAHGDAVGEAFQLVEWPQHRKIQIKRNHQQVHKAHSTEDQNLAVAVLDYICFSQSFLQVRDSFLGQFRVTGFYKLVNFV
jgi:hypothetical protein